MLRHDFSERAKVQNKKPESKFDFGGARAKRRMPKAGEVSERRRDLTAAPGLPRVFADFSAYLV
jgi:hypothetical protein